MKVLSLFGGIEAGRVALDILGIKPQSYHSAEFDPYPMKVSAANYPDITHIGSVTEVNWHDFEGIDLLIGWPPCQDLSIAGKRAGLEGSRSSLFWEYVRILNEAKPKFFLVENVASMSKEAKSQITEALFGIEPVLINSALVSAQNRKRLFWVGKRNEDGTYSKVDVPQPEDKWILLKDILEDIPLTDERWKPLPEKFVGIVKNKLECKKFLLNIPRGNNKWCVCEGKTHAMTRSLWEYNNILVAQFRRSDIRIHADQENAPTLTANMGTGGNNVPVMIGYIGTNSQGNRIYATDWKWVTVNSQTGWKAWPASNLILWLAHRNRGEGKEPECNGTEKANSITSVQSDSEVLAISEEPKYYWRKLTVRECARLQTFPDTFSFDSVSASRAYKGIGNSWTVDVISHIFTCILRNYEYVPA